jgi:hypothetical protein
MTQRIEESERRKEKQFRLSQPKSFPALEKPAQPPNSLLLHTSGSCRTACCSSSTMVLQGPSRRLLASVLQASAKPSRTRISRRYASAATAAATSSSLPYEVRSEIQVRLSVQILVMIANCEPSNKHHCPTRILLPTQQLVPFYTSKPHI